MTTEEMIQNNIDFLRNFNSNIEDLHRKKREVIKTIETQIAPRTLEALNHYFNGVHFFPEEAVKNLKIYLRDTGGYCRHDISHIINIEGGYEASLLYLVDEQILKLKEKRDEIQQINPEVEEIDDEDSDLMKMLRKLDYPYQSVDDLMNKFRQSKKNVMKFNKKSIDLDE